MKKYTLQQSDAADDQKTVVISKDVTETKEEKTTVAQLKEQHAQKLKQLSRVAQEADDIADKLSDINDNIPEIAVDKIPEHVTNDRATKASVPKSKK